MLHFTTNGPFLAARYNIGSTLTSDRQGAQLVKNPLYTQKPFDAIHGDLRRVIANKRFKSRIVEAEILGEVGRSKRLLACNATLGSHRLQLPSPGLETNPKARRVESQKLPGI